MGFKCVYHSHFLKIIEGESQFCPCLGHIFLGAPLFFQTGTILFGKMFLYVLPLFWHIWIKFKRVPLNLYLVLNTQIRDGLIQTFVANGAPRAHYIGHNIYFNFICHNYDYFINQAGNLIIRFPA